jgi:hypothetical protein
MRRILGDGHPDTLRLAHDLDATLRKDGAAQASPAGNRGRVCVRNTNGVFGVGY